ncbi:MAG TPA: hypothetical protein DIC60_00290 [Lachnospiraceae bacterium]|nr:hypothetical protein [Lachnospiraceae bacterium]
MNNSYNNLNKYNRRRGNGKSFSPLRGRILNTLLTTVFSTTFLSFTVFLVLFSVYVTPNDIGYFKKYAKIKIENSAKNVSVLAVNASQLTSQAITDLIDAAKEKHENAMAAKEVPIASTPQDIINTTEVILNSGSGKVTYFSQEDHRWGKIIYGNDNTISVYGCGPTTVAMLASSLTDTIVYPNEVAEWAYENGEFANNGGSYHSIITHGAANYGLTAKSLIMPTKETIKDELAKGNLVVALMDKGHFTSDGHFIILRGITENNELLIADAKSLENSQKVWDFDVIISEAKYGANNGGPFWSIGKK